MTLTISHRARTIAVAALVAATALLPAASRPAVHAADASTIKLATGQLITVGFVPAGASLPKPSAATITTMLQSISTAGATTTTTVPATATIPPTALTTVPSSSSTTAPTTATTSAGTPTTSATTVARNTSTTKAVGGQPSK